MPSPRTDNGTRRRRGHQREHPAATAAHYEADAHSTDTTKVMLWTTFGFQKVRPEASAATPWRKTHHRLRVDVLYSRFINARVGPYARFGLRTSLFESNMLVTEDTSIQSAQRVLFRYAMGS